MNTGIKGWYLKATPSLKYTILEGSAAITCYNISTMTVLPNYSQWYKITSNGTLQQLSTDVNDRVTSDGSQLRISSIRKKDNGTYCCKGPTQALDACNESATATLMIVKPPVILPGKNQTVFVRSNVILECIIDNVGHPPFAVFRWQKSQRRLETDGTKYTSQLIGNRMVLIISNSTSDDEGNYRCILETPTFQRRQATVYLAVDSTRIAHTGLTNGNYKMSY